MKAFLFFFCRRRFFLDSLFCIPEYPHSLIMFYVNLTCYPIISLYLFQWFVSSSRSQLPRGSDKPHLDFLCQGPEMDLGNLP